MRRTLPVQAWRAIWHESLDAERRRTIRRAVNRGQALLAPDDAAVAVELARRLQGPTWWLIPVSGVPMLLAAAYGAVNYWHFMGSWWRVNVSLWAVSGVVGPLVRAWRYRRWRQAEQLNQTVLDAVDDL